MDREAPGRRGSKTRLQLIKAARDLFGRRGFEATSIEAVLERAGVSRGALYHHFATKEDLFEAVSTAVEADIARQVRAAVTGATDRVVGLRIGCETWIRVASSPAVRRIAIIDAPAVLGWRRWRDLQEAYALGMVKDGVRALAEAGHLDADLVDVFALTLFASVCEIASFTAAAPHGDDAMLTASRAVDEILERLIRV